MKKTKDFNFRTSRMIKNPKTNNKKKQKKTLFSETIHWYQTVLNAAVF